MSESKDESRGDFLQDPPKPHKQPSRLRSIPKTFDCLTDRSLNLLWSAAWHFKAKQMIFLSFNISVWKLCCCRNWCSRSYACFNSKGMHHRSTMDGTNFKAPATWWILIYCFKSATDITVGKGREGKNCSQWKCAILLLFTFKLLFFYTKVEDFYLPVCYTQKFVDVII